MNREIKFAFWHKQKKEMWGVDSIDWRLKEVCNGGDIASLDDGILLQYTGLEDKNGKEIFIGDLVKFINPMPIEAKEEIAEVKFVLEDNFLPYIYPFVNISSYNYETKHFEGFGVNSKDCEVIGNIYENSELLKKREKNNDR